MACTTGRPITEFASYLKRELTTHTRRVQNIYKRICRNEESWLLERHEIRYRLTIIRAEFEKHRHVKDMRLARSLLDEGERYLFKNIHPSPRYFTFSPGGVCFERYADYPDWHLDHWHPLEKARYPYYFAKREQRKKEYIEMWEKGNPGKALEDLKAATH
ncbi:NADH dehydrogenase [ubiquinone] 1 beta subcomplex subunit 9-like [Oppia nitens]|uniref:NADH dehydrogenase [ubiquinone] 1 beta subcomplex subunit 9-like n=1 Tax=Oppia nitens TaxID=1686743 RepID=UPI0023DAA058|nr:NADH dehydrogenase [ubiquinone] 1 beta subcomplex subunit 9-like [Oppia nitens]